MQVALKQFCLTCFRWPGVTAFATFIPFLLDCVIDFFPVNADMLGSFDSKADLVPLYRYNHQCDRITDDNFFILFAAENEHEFLVPFGGPRESSVFLSSDNS